MLVSRDFILFFISFELFNFSSYLLLGTIQNRHSSLAATLKYFLLSSFVTAILLGGILMIYFITGATHYDHISLITSYFASHVADSMWLQVGFILLLIPLFFKLAAAPFHFYAPDLYSSLPSPYAFYLLT